MKTLFTLTLALLIASCTNPKKKEANNPTAELPPSLSNSEYSISSKVRGSYEDLVNAMFKELLEKDEALKSFDQALNELNDNKSSAIENWNDFNSKNSSYYYSAQQHVSQIKDTALRLRMDQLLKTHQDQYKQLVKNDEALLELIGKNNAVLNDNFEVIKLMKTMELIKNYQKDHKPDSKPMDNYIKEQQKLIQQSENFIK